MNYLAHAYLSFGDGGVLTGNLISDFVKGRRKLDYSGAILTGITLHRAIDTFTDAHVATHRAKAFFRPEYGLYSGPLVDIAYDHFLAADTRLFPSDGDLASFAARSYAMLEQHAWSFPDRFGRLFPYMRDQDWFSGYRYAPGIFASFAGLARRASYMPPADMACRLLEKHYEGLEGCYREFFPAVRDHAAATLAALREGEQ